MHRKTGPDAILTALQAVNAERGAVGRHAGCEPCACTFKLLGCLGGEREGAA
jgi:hypothetical protein